MSKQARPPAFVTHTLPWLDRARGEIESYLATRHLGEAERARLRRRLFDWMRDGFVVLACGSRACCAWAKLSAP